MLVDEVEIIIRAGHGGAGKVSFVRSRSQKGGPDGGNGGKGGDVYLRVVSDLSALNQFTRKKIVEGNDGKAGESMCKSGKNGDDIDVVMPVGSVLINRETDEEIELNKINERILIAKGGIGGRGNFEFKSPSNTTPKYAQPGRSGDEKKLRVILKLIADFGLIGLPNAGKSSLLNELTAAKAKIAEYPFTTLEPNLGVMDKKVLADIPGLIEGAAEGKGLGIKFLKHIEKVSALLHCISSESEDVLADYEVVRNEMAKFSPELFEKEEIILLTKTDLVSREEVEEKIKKLKTLKRNILPVSIHDYDSLEELKKILVSF
jgi:GTP-binding protein